MRPSTALCLLILAFIVVSISSKRIYRKGKTKDSVSEESKKPTTQKSIKKKNSEYDESEYDEEYEEESEDEEMEDEEDIEEEDDDSDVEEEYETDEEESTEEESGDEESEEDETDDDEGSVAEESEREDESAVIASPEFKGEKREDLKEKGIFYSLDDIKEFFNGHDYQDDVEIADLLKRFNVTEVTAQEKLEAYKHKPLNAFYVVEGVNSDTRRKVAQILAHRLKGLYIVNQPRVSIGPLPKYEEAKKPYYALSKYAIANKVLLSLYHTPVVIESYWTEHASYIMAKIWEKASKLPTPGSEVYRFPEDLLRPNITFTIFNTPPPRLGKGPSKQYLMEQRQLLVYKRFTGTKVHVIRFPESAKQIADKIDLYLHGQESRRPHDTFEITLAE